MDNDKISNTGVSDLDKNQLTNKSVSDPDKVKFKTKFVQLFKKRGKQINVEKQKFDLLNQMIWITPLIILLLIFGYWCIALVFRDGLNGSRKYLVEFSLSFVNFKNIFFDTEFVVALKNSLIYAVVAIPITLLITLFTAKCISNILNQRMFSFIQVMFFMPYVTSAMAVAMSFSMIFSPTASGLMNRVLSWIGLDPTNWYGGGKGIYVLLAFGIWHSMPFKIIMFTGAFMRVDAQYYHAASVDGMPKWKQFWRISLPGIVPMIIYMVTTDIITSFKIFPLGLFPDYNSSVAAGAQTVVYYIYNKISAAEGGFISRQKGSAASMILMVIILVLTIINRYVTKYLNRRYK